MSDQSPSTAAVERIIRLIENRKVQNQRTLVAIAGPPGSGKSTLAESVAQHWNHRARLHDLAVIQMDGYHLDNSQLEARNLSAAKGAPETFDVGSFIELVRRVRDDDGPLSYSVFDRDRDETVPAPIDLQPEVRTVIFEGNYLLFKGGEWARLKPFFNATVMLKAPLEVLENRLIDRWLSHGLPLSEARFRVASNDMVNARDVLERSWAADLTVDHIDWREAPVAQAGKASALRGEQPQ